MTKSLTLSCAGYDGSGGGKNQTDYDSVVVRRPTWCGRQAPHYEVLIEPLTAERHG
jgi:hypothetical protein